MRDCYDSLVFAAAATPNSAYGKHYSSHLFVNIAHVVSLYSSLIMYSKLLNWLCVLFCYVPQFLINVSKCLGHKLNMHTYTHIYISFTCRM